MGAELETPVAAYEERAVDLVATDPELAEVVLLRFFGGLTEDCTARVLGASRRTVLRRWGRLGSGSGPPSAPTNERVA